MSAPRQRTIARPVSAAGRGLHSGRRVNLAILPAPAGGGIRFRRSDLSGDAATVAADWRWIGDTRLCTGLCNAAGVRVRTVEHLLAACYGCGIDNAVVELDAEELPIFDGSAAPFVALLEQAGRTVQEAPRRCIRIDAPVELGDGETVIRLEPADGLEVDFTLVLPGFGRMRWAGPVGPDRFRAEIAAARTYGRLAEAWPLVLLGRLRLAPLLRGVSPGNALGIVGRSVINRGGLRMPDEFVRHRVLDIVGDLMLAGAPIQGRLTAVRTGHRWNAAILRALFGADDAWSWVAASSGGD